MSDLLTTLWTVAHQALLSMGFPRQEHWGGLPFPSPGHLHNPGIKSNSPTLVGRFFTTEPPGLPRKDIVVQLPSCVWLFVTPWTAALQISLSLTISWNLPGKNTGMGCHFFLQGTFQIQRLNLNLWIWKVPWRKKWKWKWSRSVMSDS